MARCPSVDGAASSAAASSADKSITEATSPNLGDLPRRARRGSQRLGFKKRWQGFLGLSTFIGFGGWKIDLGSGGGIRVDYHFAQTHLAGVGENFPALVRGAGGAQAPPTWEILVACLSIKLRLEKVGRERRGIKVEEKCGGSRK